ncbi:MAG: hypothetical protein ACRC11_19730 [Xenococcaceae cyanobacterium]
MSCGCNSNSNSGSSAYQISKMYVGDTVEEALNMPSTAVVNAASTIEVIVKELANNLPPLLFAIADLTNGNDFSQRIVRFVSNYSFLPGTYQLLVKITNGTTVHTYDLAKYIQINLL